MFWSAAMRLHTRRGCSDCGGTATAYTLIETAKLNAVDPHAWLADALARIPYYKTTNVDVLPP